MKKKFFGLLLLTAIVCGCSNGEGTSSITGDSSYESELESSVVNSGDSSENSSLSESSSVADETLKSLTIAEFLNQKDTSTFYKLTGTVKQITNTTYGNFILEDDTGSIFVWGLYPSEGSTDKYGFSSLNIKVGDKIVIAGVYKYYAEDKKDEVVDAYFISKVSSSGGNSSSGGSSSDVNLITNEGKGLPSSQNGVYDIDFTKAKYVKNVTEQGYYLDGCPTLSTTTSNPAVLVVPVEFSDITASSKGFTIDNIERAFVGDEDDTDYYSVHDYYYESSYGQLDLDITILDYWFRPKNTSSYYASATMEYNGREIECGDQLIIDEVLASLEDTMDLTKFDSDGNKIIDSIVLINTLEIDSKVTFNWAYRYWNLYTDDEGYYYEYDGVSANDYLWASYSFMHETNGGNNVSYDDRSVMNTYTYIHEFGHVLGADDYYDTAYKNEPLGGCDVMDAMTGDHNPYSKFNYGWLTSSRLVVAENTITLDLEDFSRNGDTIIIANNWDDDLGAYQEYYVVMYYTNNGLNSGDYGYFSRNGIVVYHVNASLYSQVNEGETYYDVYNTNTDSSDEYGTVDNLIEFVKTSDDAFTYVVGDSLSSSIVDDQGNKISYTFKVDALSSTTATLTFTKN